MQKIQASDPSASNVSQSSVEDCQSHRANDDDTDTSISSDLLNAGGRVVKGKLRKVDPRKVRRSRMANRSIDDEPSSKLLRLTELMRSSRNLLPRTVTRSICTNWCTATADTMCACRNRCLSRRSWCRNLKTLSERF
jgi:hypothetical protein